VLLPVIFTNGVKGALTYLTTPMMVLALVFLVLVVKLTEAGKTVTLSPRDQRMAYWFLMNGVFYNMFLDVVSGQFQMMDEMSRQYLKVEPRYELGPYKVSGMPVFWTSMCEIFFQSPLCLMVYFGYRRGKPWRRPVEIIVSLLHVAGVWFFYVPEAFAAFPHLNGWPKTVKEALSFDRLLFFWFGFWAMGILWTVVPIAVMHTNVKEIAAIIAEHDAQGAVDDAPPPKSSRNGNHRKSKSPASRR